MEMPRQIASGSASLELLNHRSFAMRYTLKPIFCALRRLNAITQQLGPLVAAAPGYVVRINA